MLLTLKIALLNLARNKRRTLFSLVNLVLCLAAVLMFQGFAESMYEGLRESMIRSNLGHIQIYAKGFNQYGSLNDAKYYLSEQARNALIADLGTIRGVAGVSARLETYGLLTNGVASMPVNVVGADPDKEATLSSAIRVVAGRELFSDKPNEALLGKALAEALNVKIGDDLTILGTSVGQSINAVDVVVAGFVTTSIKEIDRRLVLGDTALTEQLLLTRGATRLVVLLEKTSETDNMLGTIQQSLQGSPEPVEYRTWSELADYYHQVVSLFDAIFIFINVIVLGVAGLAISNALSMSVVERTREIGVVRAIGGSRTEIARLFLWEGALIGIAGGVLGVVVGVLLAKLITSSGLRMPTPPGSTVDYPLRILLKDPMLIQAFCLGAFVAVLASLYPAIKASRMNILKALRHA